MGWPHRSTSNPFCRHAGTGPPLFLALSLGVFLLIGGVGGGITYVTREKPKGDGRARVKSPEGEVAAPAYESLRRPAPEESQRRPPPPDWSTRQKVAAELFGLAASRTWGHPESPPDADDSQTRAVKWGEMSRESQEESAGRRPPLQR